MASFADMINGTPQMMGPGADSGKIGQVVMPQGEQTGLDQSPPKSPEELQQRVGAWQSFIQRMQTDPTLQHAMLMTGAQMLAGPQFMGENTGSILGRAMQTGVLSHQMGKAAEAKNALAQRGENRADTLAQARVGAAEAGIEEKRQKIASDKEILPLKKKRMDLETQAAEQTLANQPQLLESSLKTAESQRARNYAMANRANRPAGTGSPTKESVIESLMRRRYPEASDQELAQYVLDHGAKTPKEDLLTLNAQAASLAKLVETGSDKTVIAKAEQKLAKMLGLEGGAEPAASAQPITEEEFKAAAKKADANGKFKLRGKEYTLKSGVKP